MGRGFPRLVVGNLSTGFEKANGIRSTTIWFENETELHHRVVAFIRKYYKDANISSFGGEFQDTPEKRIDAWRRGYSKGSFDICILNANVHWNGFLIELKHPMTSGKLSTNQEQR